MFTSLYQGRIFSANFFVLNLSQNGITQQEKDSLLVMARRILTNAFTKAEKKELFAPALTTVLRKSMGAFVTLYKNKKQLRGCIGRIISNESLWATVAAMTEAAAFNDPRFSPVKQEEVPGLTINISVLTQPHAIASYRDIKLGEHGIILKKNGHSAVFLPEVATEFGWDVPTTLTHLSQKAGLPHDAWKGSDVCFEVFESIAFSE